MFVPVKEEHRTAFFGEDIHIYVPPGNAGEVVFKPRVNRSSEVVLLRAGQVASPRGIINSLGHLVLEDVQEEDEGMYVIKNTNHPNTAKHLILIVRGELSAVVLSRGGDSVRSIQKINLNRFCVVPQNTCGRNYKPLLSSFVFF